MVIDVERSLYPLLDYLAQNETRTEGEWRGWRITRIAGGMNNVLYRATNVDRDFAIKFTIRDVRDRAGREYRALLALQQAGLPIAPEPILLDRECYAQPVVVQTWLEGEVHDTPPTNDAEWNKLLEHFATVHTVTPDNTPIELPQAVLTAYSVEMGKTILQNELSRVPSATQPESLKQIVRRFEALQIADWSYAPVTLCHVDPNTLNFIRRPDGWAAVDWENAGWGDPAFEIADLTTHPAYIRVPGSRWDWVIEKYGTLTNDVSAATRVRAYRKIMAVWWVARIARYLYEIPRGLDKRLVTPSANWQAEVQAKYEHYFNLANSEI